MRTVKITTAQNIDIDYEVAGLGDRFLARFIDYSIFFAVYMVFMFVMVGSAAGYAASGGSMGEWGFTVMIIIWIALCVIYDLVCEVFFNGQSIGKRALKIRVISLTGARPKVSQYLLRWLMRIIDFGISFGTAAVVAVAFSDDKQRLGDVVAGTVVVKTEPQTVFTDLMFKAEDENYEPVYQEVTQLTDKDMALVYEVIRIFNRTRNSNLVFHLAIKIKNYLNVSYPAEINEYQFLEIVVRDYNSLVIRAGQ